MKQLALKKADIPLEVVILLIGGMTLLITGGLLFPVSAGALPYYENGLHGLLLVTFAMQIITLGETPFGDMRKSRRLVAVGVMIAAVGIAACFVPIFRRIPRMLLFLCFGLGGFFQLARMCIARDKLRAWIKYGGIFHHLVFGCSLVYVFSMLFAALLWKRALFSTPMTAALALMFGLGIVYLCGVLRKIYAMYPSAGKTCEGDSGLSMDQSMILLMGCFMLILGALLIPVNLGLLPFSGSAQLGLLMVIFAVQMLASGSTPIGPFPRTWLMIVFGLLFAALGIVSCIIPEILVSPLTALIGALNIIGGVTSLIKTGLTRLRRSDEPDGSVPSALTRLFSAQLTMNLLTILFGAAMLVPHLIPGLVIGLILAANGCVLLYLMHILTVLDAIQRSAACAVCPQSV